MKSNAKTIRWAALVALVLLGWGLIDWPGVVRSAKDLSTPSPTPGESAVTVVSESLQAVMSIATKTKARITRATKLAALAEFENINASLWGLTLDQDDLPLPGVTVRVMIRYSKPTSMLMGFGFIPRETVSGPDGRFAIIGDKGDMMEIRAMEKVDYQIEKTAPGFIGYGSEYAFPTNANRPIIFKLWKDSARQPLIIRGLTFGMIPDGRAYTVDLAAGKQSQSEDAAGDVRLRVTRPVTAGLWDNYAWTYDVDVVEGGLIEVRKEIYIAPTEGYTNQFQCFNPAATSGWGGFNHAQFVLKLRGGKAYARLEVEVWARYGDNPRDALIKIRSAFNPTGSRKLN